MEIKEFINIYYERILENKAIVFIGSGINKEVGLPDWSELLDETLASIGLSTEELKSSGYFVDNIDLAHYVRIQNNNNKTNIIESIKKKLDTTKIEPGPNLNEIAKLPISDFWTTNYDQLIEKAFINCNKNYNSIISKNEFALSGRKKVNLYKMHGDISDVKSIVIDRKDYDEYEKEHLFFWNKLALEMGSKTCVFVGTSFNDYNLNVILSRISSLVDEEFRSQHYIFFKKEENDVARKLQSLKISQLRNRFNIETILIDDYSEIETIFKQVNLKCKLRNVLISGAISEYENGFSDKKVDAFVSNLTYELVKTGYKIVNGYGLGIGNPVVVGAESAISEFQLDHDFLEITPFPRNILNSDKRNEVWNKVRQNMVRDTGIMIIMFGNKIVDGKVVNSEGMLDEFHKAKANGLRIIPLPFTGYMAEEIWKLVKKDMKEYSYLKKWESTLEKTDFSLNIPILISIINDVSN